MLKSQFKESDGQLCNVFAAIGNEGTQTYSCILCLIDGMNVPSFISHANSESHRIKERVRVATEKSFSSIFNIGNYINTCKCVVGVD